MTKRMIVVEIRLTIGGSAVVVETPLEEAEGWSGNFLSLTAEGCALVVKVRFLMAWNTAVVHLML